MTADVSSGQLRYSYRMQPTIFWWNLTRLGEALAELFGAGDSVDAYFGRKDFIEGSIEDSELEPILTKAEKIISVMADEYKTAFLDSYKATMSLRIGFPVRDEDDFKLVSEALTLMETYELDFHQFFRKLSDVDFSADSIIGQTSGNFGGAGKEKALEELENFLVSYRSRLSRGDIQIDTERTERMKRSNPSFVLRSWILDEAIRKVEQEGDRDILQTLSRMGQSPFQDWQDQEGQRFCGPVPSGTVSGANTQCSCSS